MLPTSIPYDILVRVSVFMESPLLLALADKRLYSLVSCCPTKALWIKFKFPGYKEKLFPAAPDFAGNCSSLAAGVENENVGDDAESRRLSALVSEPLFFHLVKMDNLHISFWADFAIEKGYQRSFRFLLSRHSSTPLCPEKIIDMTMMAILHQRKNIIALLVEKMTAENILALIPASLIFDTARAIFERIDRCQAASYTTPTSCLVPFELATLGETLLIMEKLLPPYREIRCDFLNYCLQLSSSTPRVCLQIIGLSEYSLDELDIDWQLFEDDGGLDFVIRGLGVTGKMAVTTSSNGRYFVKELVECVIAKNFTKCLASILEMGIVSPTSLNSLFKLGVYSNSPGCVHLLLKHVSRISQAPGQWINVRADGDSISKSLITHNQARILSLVLPFWKDDIPICQSLMYHAILSDSPTCLKVILTVTHSDQESLKIAISKIGRNRTNTGETCLDLLLNSNPEVIEAVELSQEALRHVGNFVQTQVLY